MLKAKIVWLKTKRTGECRAQQDEVLAKIWSDFGDCRCDCAGLLFEK